MTVNPKLEHIATYTGARTYHFKSTAPLGGWARAIRGRAFWRVLRHSRRRDRGSGRSLLTT